MQNINAGRLSKMVGAAQGDYAWDFGDDILYRLCEENPAHNDIPKVVAKLWLIGRSYAAAIERGSGDGGDQLYTKKAAPALKQSDIDKHIQDLPPGPGPDASTIVLKTHKRLCDVLAFTRRQRRSFSSKYLHFHRRDLFYLYDSRAAAQINGLLRSLGVERERIPLSGTVDHEYAKFFQKADLAVQEIRQRTGKTLNPRQLDRLLLFEFPSR